MEKVAVQLTVERLPGEEPPQRLARRGLVDIAELPCAVEIPGSGELFTLSQESCGICLDGAGDALVNGKPWKVGEPLRIGDRISLRGYEFGFFIRRPAKPLSFSSRFIAGFAKCAVALCMAVEIWIMCGLPSMLVGASLWDGAIALQRISQRIERLRKKASELELETPARRVIAAELSRDLNDRARYVRAYDRGIRRSQRRMMLDDLARIEKILDRLGSQEPVPLDEIGEPGIDAAVRKILGDEPGF